MRLLVIGLLLLGSPAAVGQASDEAKRQRIDELYRGYRKELGRFPELTVEQVLERRNKGQDPLLVDAREPREQRVSMIRGAITARDFLKQAERHRKRKRIVVVYCTIGYRSAKLVKDLRRRGALAYNLVGGILSWVHKKQPLVDPRGRPTRRVHVYGKTWDLAPRGYQTVW
jgi:rhodanese-related sulfurtransferase